MVAPIIHAHDCKNIKLGFQIVEEENINQWLISEGYAKEYLLK